MAREEFMRMDRELSSRLRLAGTVEDREKLVIDNLRRKEAIIATDRERDGVVPPNSVIIFPCG